MDEDRFKIFIQRVVPRCMLDSRLKWIEKGILSCDLFSAHHSEENIRKLKHRNHDVGFVPGGCTGIAQVHDVYVNKEVKSHV